MTLFFLAKPDHDDRPVADLETLQFTEASFRTIAALCSSTQSETADVVLHCQHVRCLVSPCSHRELRVTGV